MKIDILIAIIVVILSLIGFLFCNYKYRRNIPIESPDKTTFIDPGIKWLIPEQILIWLFFLLLIYISLRIFVF